MDYVVRVSPRARRVILRVTRAEGLVVVVPPGFNKKNIPGIVEARRAWIDRAVQRIGKPEALAAPHVVDLPALGESWTVFYVPSEKNEVRLTPNCHGTLRIEGQVESTETVVDVLKQWLTVKAKAHLFPWLQAVSAETRLPYGRAGVRSQSTRWASCSKDGNISLNRSLLFLPPELVRHVFIHELCHTKHMDHSPKFWKTFEKLEPDCRKLEAQVKRAEKHVPIWAQPRGPG